MIRSLLAGFAALSLSVSAAAEEPVFTAEAFRSHVAFLADDLLEGREAGTRGYDIAAHYVATQFEGLGLRPGANGSWFQEIEFVRSSLAGTPRLTIGERTFEAAVSQVNCHDCAGARDTCPLGKAAGRYG